MIRNWLRQEVSETLSETLVIYLLRARVPGSNSEASQCPNRKTDIRGWSACQLIDPERRRQQRCAGRRETWRSLAGSSRYHLKATAMQSRFIPLAAAAAVLATLACNTATDPTTASTAARPSLANDKHLLPGTPGDANCKGQTTAFAAQFGKNYGLAYRGFAAAAGAGDVAGEPLTVQELHALIDAFCAQ